MAGTAGPCSRCRVRRSRRAQLAPALPGHVREPWEFARGHLAEASLIPLGELEARVGEIPRERPILAICQSGQRSLAAAAYLLQLGYPEVVNVDGGTSAWIEKGYPVSR
ncbi:MAG: rhodanese-like domain-containing protein [Chloroflexi bacterium]|nr:MAG: rhodanese-like domain-containing protein [Chloroflexota bacterium]